MEEKLSGIVLSSVNYSENDKILTIFTLERGAITAKIKGVKRSGAKLKFASEPFCFAEYVFSAVGERRTVIGASLIESFYPLREDIIRFYSASAVIEFVKRFERENIVSPELFVLTVETLKQLAYGENNPSRVLAKFFIGGLELVGYALKLDGCMNCDKDFSSRVFFDYMCGGFFCEECQAENQREINKSTLIALRQAKADDLNGDYNYTGAIRLINYYLINRTEEKLKSLAELIKILN